MNHDDLYALCVHEMFPCLGSHQDSPKDSEGLGLPSVVRGRVGNKTMGFRQDMKYETFSFGSGALKISRLRRTEASPGWTAKSPGISTTRAGPGPGGIGLQDPAWLENWPRNLAWPSPAFPVHFS